jgi:phospholipid-binding lipoprotein MlaA
MGVTILGNLRLQLGLAAFAVLLAGCATPPPADDTEGRAQFAQTNDPLEPTNRAIFAFNQGVDTVLLRPAAQGYRFVMPKFGRDRVADFLANLEAPIILMNDALQGNFGLAGKTLGRFALNTTFGVVGIMDVATPMGIKGHDSDFGETLGVWGVGSGPYIVLPFLGPSDVRDAAGTVVDYAADPWDWYLYLNHKTWVSYVRYGVEAISDREQLLDPLDDVKRSSLDYYAALRSIYRQRREALVTFGSDPAQHAPPPPATVISPPKQ